MGRTFEASTAKVGIEAGKYLNEVFVFRSELVGQESFRLDEGRRLFRRDSADDGLERLVQGVDVVGQRLVQRRKVLLVAQRYQVAKCEAELKKYE